MSAVEISVDESAIKQLVNASQIISAVAAVISLIVLIISVTSKQR